MKPSKSFRQRVKAAAIDVVEFALVSLQPEFLRWDKDVNLGVAEMVWNLYSRGMDGATPRCSESRSPCGAPGCLDVDDLLERLQEAREVRWGHQQVMVFGLDVRYEGGEVTFSFDLTWDDAKTLHPCEVVWEAAYAGPGRLN